MNNDLTVNSYWNSHQISLLYGNHVRWHKSRQKHKGEKKQNNGRGYMLRTTHVSRILLYWRWRCALGLLQTTKVHKSACARTHTPWRETAVFCVHLVVFYLLLIADMNMIDMQHFALLSYRVFNCPLSSIAYTCKDSAISTFIRDLKQSCNTRYLFSLYSCVHSVIN